MTVRAFPTREEAGACLEFMRGRWDVSIEITEAGMYAHALHLDTRESRNCVSAPEVPAWLRGLEHQ